MAEQTSAAGSLDTHAAFTHSEEQFESFATTCRPQIFRFLLASLRDVDLAETLTQECLLRGYRSWPSFRGDSSVKTWLMNIAVNLQKDHWRSRRLQFWTRLRSHSVHLDDVSQWLPSSHSSPEARVSAREQVALVWKIVHVLPEKQRTIFLLRFVEDLNAREIAEVTGMALGTVKAHLHRGLTRVRAELTARQHRG